MMSIIQCSNCKNPYPADGIPYRCIICGGVYDIPRFSELIPDLVEAKMPGIWRYRHTFGLVSSAPIISLGEGNTPLVWSEVSGRQVAFKCEYLNPTGSFKDRGSSVIASFICSRGAETAIEDSSGNAGASFAAYASRAGLNATIYVPDSASGPKRQQIELYGAKLVRILGPRSKTSDAVIKLANGGAVYASHAYLPQNLPGYATLAYELVEQLGTVPQTVILPIGQGGLFIGLVRGFENLLKSKLIQQMPKLVGIQALACPSIWSVYKYGHAGFAITGESSSVAEGIMVRYPVRGDTILQLCTKYDAELYAVDEGSILPGRDQLARRGFLVEPTSAIVWNPLMEEMSHWKDPIVVILTGSGLKAMI